MSGRVAGKAEEEGAEVDVAEVAAAAAAAAAWEDADDAMVR